MVLKIRHFLKTIDFHMRINKKKNEYKLVGYEISLEKNVTRQILIK